MHVLVVHRDYRLKGGEDFFLETVLLPALSRTQIPHTVLRLPPLFSGDSNFFDVFEMLFLILGLEKLRPSYFKLRAILKKTDSASRNSNLGSSINLGGFTHVLFNNFIPTVSLAAPKMFKQNGLKTFWWAHNARMTCANGLLYNGHEVCHRCLTKGSSWVFKQRCYPSLNQSFLYAWIYRFQRVIKNVGPHLDKVIASSVYTTKSLNEGFQKCFARDASTEIIYMPTAERTGKSDGTRTVKFLGEKSQKPYVFLGRVSHEKGADVFVELARKNPKKMFVMAGGGPMLENLKNQAPKNIFFLGFISEAEKIWLFENAEALIIPSRVPENSSLVIFESHPYGTPIVYPRGGGAEEMAKYLARAGCALESFSGQVFSKLESVKTADSTFFEKNLTNLFQ